MIDKKKRHALVVHESIIQKARILAAVKGTNMSQMYEIFIEKEYDKATIKKERN